jgi:exopolysaccharide production protein ExoQ
LKTIKQTQNAFLEHTGTQPAILFTVTLIIAWAFFISNWNFSISDGGLISSDQLVESVGSGSMGRKIAYGLIGLLGIGLILLPSSLDNNPRHLAILFFCIYLLICTTSLAWSHAPEITLRRLAILFFCVLAIIGILRHLSPKELLTVGLIVCVFYCGVGLLVEFAYQSFHPFESGYRYSGTFHPNSMGSVCSAMVMASFCIAKEGGRRQLLFWILMAIGLVLLFLTKSRSAFFSCCVALFTILFLRSSFHAKMLLIFIPPALLGLFLLLPQLFQLNVGDPIEMALHLGRDIETTEMTTLNGRLPLWQTLTAYIAEAPWVGYGYHGFWTAFRISDFLDDFQWLIPNAHSVVMDTFLNVGLLGATFYLSAMFLSVIKLMVQCIGSDTPAANFAMGITMIALVGAIFESGFLDPTDFVPFLLYTLLFQVVSQPQPFVFSEKVPS